MATLVAFHAHPDDESISMGGTMAQAAAAGHKVVVVTATDGAVGEVDEGYLDEGESLAARRAGELQAAAAILGIDRAVQLGYRDSGMMGTADNDHPAAFWSADIDEAASKLAAILREEGADILTVYDSNGGYGHPDHIQVHRVGHAAAEMADVEHVYEVSMNRERIVEMRELRDARDGNSGEEASGEDEEPGPGNGEIDFEKIGLSDADLTTAVDVSAILHTKRAAMAAHGSQIDEESWFLSLPSAIFARAFGMEWFRQTKPAFVGDPVADRQSTIFPSGARR